MEKWVIKNGRMPSQSKYASQEERSFNNKLYKCRKKENLSDEFAHTLGKLDVRMLTRCSTHFEKYDFLKNKYLRVST